MTRCVCGGTNRWRGVRSSGWSSTGLHSTHRDDPGCWVGSGRASHDAHISKSRYGHPHPACVGDITAVRRRWILHGDQPQRSAGVGRDGRSGRDRHWSEDSALEFGRRNQSAVDAGSSGEWLLQVCRAEQRPVPGYAGRLDYTGHSVTTVDMQWEYRAGVPIVGTTLRSPCLQQSPVAPKRNIFGAMVFCAGFLWGPRRAIEPYRRPESLYAVIQKDGTSNMDGVTSS
jgi:hypothetical protein